MKLLIFSILFLLKSQLSAYERADAFIIRAYTKRYKVLSPPKYQAKTSLIVENKTNIKLLGKVMLESGKRLGHMAIRPGKFDSMVLSSKKGERIYFVPLSPPFQKFELKFGTRPYEIPPKK